MRCSLNELGYHVTKKGETVYKRRSRPFTLRRIYSIYRRSFWPWWEESADPEKLDATGLVRPSAAGALAYAQDFWAWFEDMTKFSKEITSIAFHFINTGPDLSTIPYNPDESVSSGLQNLILQLQKLVEYIKLL